MSSSAPILAATDFSLPAHHAVRRAARLARTLGAPMALMHVMETMPLQPLSAWLGADPGAEQQMHGATRQQLGELADELRREFAVQVSTLHTAGAVVEDLLIESSSLRARCVVVGSRGAAPLQRLVLGTTTDRLLRRASQPVLVVRKADATPYRRVLVPVDFSPVSAQLLALARQFAPQARPVLFHAFEPPFESKLRRAGVSDDMLALRAQQVRVQALQQMQGLAEAQGLLPGEWDGELLEGDAKALLLIEEVRCDLVVIGKHGQSAVQDLLLGSVTNHLLAHGHADVLVVPNAP